MIKKDFSRPRARKISPKSVTNFLQQKGYHVSKIWRPWRHIVAVVKKDNQDLFFKMATTIKTSKMTENEFRWNEIVAKKINSNTCFVPPKNLEKGLFQDRLFFFISQYFGKNTLADKYPPRSKELNQWLSKITIAASLISKIDYPKDEKIKKIDVGEHLLNSATQWSLKIKSDVQPLLKAVKKSKQYLKGSFNHGDFVPWHMYDLANGKFGLVDAEHGGYRPKYYDPAYFYLRVRQSLGEKELAKKFLLQFKDLLSKKNKAIFWDELKPVLAQRLIGDFWGAWIGSQKNREAELQKCEQFKQDLIKDKII